MEIEFVGAAREVTGSCHILRVAGKTVLLDCGLFQGKRGESQAKNLRLPIAIEQIDAIVLSHAHIDHAGRLPFLVRHGYQGTIWCTPATRDLCAVMLADSAHIQEKDAEFLAKRGKQPLEPLYSLRHSTRTIELMSSVPYHRPFDVTPGIRVSFLDAGHILGSASVTLDCTESGRTQRLVFSGDIGRSGLPIIRDPEPPSGADVVVMVDSGNNCQSCMGIVDARNARPSAAELTAWFPDPWNADTWNMNAISPLILTYSNGVGNYATQDRRPH